MDDCFQTPLLLIQMLAVHVRCNNPVDLAELQVGLFSLDLGFEAIVASIGRFTPVEQLLSRLILSVALYVEIAHRFVVLPHVVETFAHDELFWLAQPQAARCCRRIIDAKQRVCIATLQLLLFFNWIHAL